MLDTRDLQFHEIASVDPCVYVRSGHPVLSLPAITEEDLSPYPYVSFEQTQGVAADFSEEYQMLSMKRSEQSVRVNSRSVMMSVLERTDGFTTGSGGGVGPVESSLPDPHDAMQAKAIRIEM